MKNMSRNYLHGTKLMLYIKLVTKETYFLPWNVEITVHALCINDMRLMNMKWQSIGYKKSLIRNLIYTNDIILFISK